MSLKTLYTRFAANQEKAAAKSFLEELFQDYYVHRFKVYKMNFVRGIVFGFGSVIGGTLMVALLLWVLSFFNQVPFVGGFTESVRNSVEQSSQ